MATLSKKRIKKLIRILATASILTLFMITALYSTKGPFSTQHTVSDPIDIKAEQILPNLTLTRLDGSPVRLSEINAKVLMITFWATWCEACMVEMPSIVQLRNMYKQSGFEVLAINLDENAEAVAPKTIQQFHMDFPIFKDNNGKIAEFFDIRAIPSSLLINRHRKILKIADGEQDWNTVKIHQQLEQWLSQ